MKKKKNRTKNNSANLSIIYQYFSVNARTSTFNTSIAAALIQTDAPPINDAVCQTSLPMPPSPFTGNNKPTIKLAAHPKINYVEIATN